MLNTELMQLRKQAPGSLTAAKIAEYFKKKRYPRTHHAIGDFERGEYETPPDRFIELYAECIGSTAAKVKTIYRRVRRKRASSKPARSSP
jgi:hypothetical protein